MKTRLKIPLSTLSEKAFLANGDESEYAREAIITHYLQNKKHGGINKFKSHAVKITQELIKYKLPEQSSTQKAAEEALQYGIFEYLDVPFPAPLKPKFTFIDLFAGIGGFRLAMQNKSGNTTLRLKYEV